MDTPPIGSPQWWWVAVLMPVGLGLRWLLSLLTSGNQRVMDRQEDMLDRLSTELSETKSELAAARHEIDMLRREIGALTQSNRDLQTRLLEILSGGKRIAPPAV